jgi:glycosyltransferase involved in cell wall biosynthesis
MADAIAAFVSDVPRLAPIRADLQKGRARTDQEIARLFVGALQPVTPAEDADGAHSLLVGSLAVDRLFGNRRRVLVVTADVLTKKMAGPAIRAWQISRALAREHDVKLVTTNGRCEITADDFDVRAVTPAELSELEQWCEVVVVQGYVLEHQESLRVSRKVMVVDVYDPLHLENLELSRGESDASRRITLRHATHVINSQLRRGDYFVCASQKQRDFWLGQLAALGRINPLTYDEDETLDRLIGIVPFGLPDDPPVRSGAGIRGVIDGIGPDDDVILWGGGIYNWFDPLTLIRAVDRLRHRRPNVRLFFLGLRHPNPEVPDMRMAVQARQLSAELGLTDTHVFFNEGWVAYEERQNFLLDADVGVSTHLDHVETAFSFRTRILDYLWAGLPIVATAGDGFADLIERERLGITVAPGDVSGLEEALWLVLDDRESAATFRKNVEAVRARYTWGQALAPLVEFVRSPRRAPDLVDPEMATSLEPPVARSEPVPLRDELARVAQRVRAGGMTAVVRKIATRLRRALSA